MRVFETKTFARFRRGTGISEPDLLEAVARAGRGLIDANLGAGVIKQRVARPGAGRSGGYRTLIVIRGGEVAFFVFGFAKNQQGNLRSDELSFVRKVASALLSLTPQALQRALWRGELLEVKHHGETSS